MGEDFKIPKKRRTKSPPQKPPTPRSGRKHMPSRHVREAKLNPELEAMSKLINTFYARSDAAPFRDPVDWKSLGLYDYPRIIRNPMDLGTVKRRLNEGKYSTVYDVAEDVRRIWKNCCKYNPEDSDFNKLGRSMHEKFEEKYERLCKRSGAEPAPSRKRPGRKPKNEPVLEKKKPKPAPPQEASAPLKRSSSRAVKRKHSLYAENDSSDETDPDDLMNSDEEAVFEKRKQYRMARKKKKEAELGIAEDAEGEEELHAIKYEIESPPPGELSCLWYSKEQFAHVFCIEKILGWKTRPVLTLESCVTPENDAETKHRKKKGSRAHKLDFDEAINMRDMAYVGIANDFRQRREVSAINPAQCPYIMKQAASVELASAKKQGTEPRFKLVRSRTEREEVYLIKWRGRSYLHCSFETEKDLEFFDQSPQQGGARAKMSRFLQAQVISHGPNWKTVLEEERRASSTPHTHHHGPDSSSAAVSSASNPAYDNDEVDDEDYFSPLFLEVDRIIGCDEKLVDRQVLARQRALNIRAEREALKEREKHDDEEEMRLKGEHHSAEEATKTEVETVDASQNSSKPEKAGEQTSDTTMDSLPADGVGSLAAPDTCSEKPDFSKPVDQNESWDPEDNVRYIVRWKGQQLTEATWEYWIDLKRDFVDEVEDFWRRQKPPSQKKVKLITTSKHPHPRSFEKMKESPVFGVSKVKRPVAKLEGDAEGASMDVVEDDADNETVLKLRGYQLEGVNWLLWNWYNERSCILADEMGLGKTIQSIGFLHQLQRIPDTKIKGPFLVVAPLSLVSQWESETREWAPDMNCIVYHGSADARDFLSKNEFWYTEQFAPRAVCSELKRESITKFQLMITTYEVVLKDANILAKIKWKALIVDEAHRLKNVQSRLFQDLVSVPRDFCLLLTGTPLQNSTEELWALLNFSDPETFGSKDDFVDQFGQLESAKQVSKLHNVLRPYLLRRVKEDVEKALPPKEETILEVTLTPIQKQFYKAIYERNTSFLYKGSKPSNAPSLMNVMMELRKCCNHPFLIKGAEDRIIDDAAANERKNQTEKEQRYKEIDYAKLTGDQLIKSSGKFVLLSKLLPKLYSGGHKVLIFSQMVRVLDLLQELLQLNHYRYERLDGSTSASKRNSAVDRFKRASLKRFVMLLSTRAGGLGLNLTAADTVIIYDSDWNPQNDLQAMARAHRIGQTRSVRVYRLLTAKTYEMHMFHSASLKLGLDRAVLAAQRQSSSVEEGSGRKRKSKAEKQEQAKEIDALLKKGAYDVFNDDDDTDAQQFMDTDIDQLLEKSSRTVTYGESATTSLASGLGSFSKASFVASTGDGDGKDVDLDDPDFWSKAVGLEAPPPEEDPTMALIIDEKRSRKQVKSYDPLAEEAELERLRLEEIAQRKEEERVEKERKKLEKQLKREMEREAKERKKREEREMKEQIKQQKAKAAQMEKDKKAKEVKSKVKQVKIVYDDRKIGRRRALKRAEHEDPISERIKQAWDTLHRNRVIAAILQHGFGRFTKVRHVSNFTSLPIQDIEVFARSYVYQLGLQAAAGLLSEIDCSNIAEDETDELLRSSLGKVLVPLVGKGKDFQFIAQSILTSMCMHLRMKANDVCVRMPLTLIEPSFVYHLTQGVAVRSLHRISFMARLNSIVEEALDRAILEIGFDEMVNRGCIVEDEDYSRLDMDLKARYVTMEELFLSLNMKFPFQSDCSQVDRPPWWDRACDHALILGTFFHGLGNYEAIRQDAELGFTVKMRNYANLNGADKSAHVKFAAAASATKQVFDDALSSLKIRFQEQTAMVVAAVHKAGSGDDTYSAKTQQLNEEDIVSLPRLQQAAVSAFRITDDIDGDVAFPDARYLDNRLEMLVDSIEEGIAANEVVAYQHEAGAEESVASINRACLHKFMTSKGDPPKILFAGDLLGLEKHNPRDYLSDYFVGAASPELADIAIGADSSRYERAPSVPLVVTRFALGAIIHAEKTIIERLRQDEPKLKATPEGPSNTNDDASSKAETDDNGMKENVTKITIADVSETIAASCPHQLTKDVRLRGDVCASLLKSGLPFVKDEVFCSISEELNTELAGNPDLQTRSKTTFFSLKDAFKGGL